MNLSIFTKQEIHAKLDKILHDFYEQLLENQIPNIKVKTRAKSNLEYDKVQAIWGLAEATTLKTAKTSGGSRQLLLLANVLAYLKPKVLSSKGCTIRELYYISESWPQAKFTNQGERRRRRKEGGDAFKTRTHHLGMWWE